MVGTTFDTATTALATICITQAENEVNKYCSKRYSIPSFLTSTPPLITTISEFYSIGLMYQFMSRGSEEGMARGKTFVDMALKNLESLRDYTVNLVDTAGSVVVDKSNTAYRILSNTDTYSPTFNEDDPLDWQQDSDKLAAIKAERK
jgi:hypothetical protein